MTKRFRMLAGAVAAVSLALGACAWAPAADAPAQATLLETLRTSESVEAKSAACRELQRVGTRDAVPALAALLGDARLAQVARAALEQVADPSADDALRGALASVRDGRLRVGILHSIGTRHDAKAVDAVAALLKDAEAEVAAAAAYALGRIGTAPAAAALEAATKAAPDAAKPALWDATLRCAEGLAERGARPEAAKVYEGLRAAPVPSHVRAAAVRGLVVSQQPAPTAILTEALHDKDPAVFNVALGLAVELPGPDVTRALAGEAAKLPADRRALLIQALGNRGGAEALAVVREAAGDADPTLRVAAIRALVQLRDVESLPMLLAATRAPEKDVAAAAVAALVRLPGQDVDAALGRRVRESADVADRLIAIDCLGRRQERSAVPVLLWAAGQDQPAVRQAALGALGEVASLAEIKPIFGLLQNAQTPADRDAVERTLVTACGAVSDKEGVAGQLLELLADAKAEHRPALLRALATVGGPKALAAVRQAAKDGQTEVATVAVGLLFDWPTPDAAADLMALAQSQTLQPNQRVLALRGWIRLANHAALPVEKRLEMCEQAGPLVRRPEEKRQLLGVLGAIPSPKALALIAPHLADAAVKEEACVAAVNAAGRLGTLPRDAEAAAAVMRVLEDVKKTSQNPRTVDGADKALARLKAAK